VGRSNEQAYAYLLTPPLSVLPKQTLRRLQALQEFTELGSGLNLALRDLEIRGAGNLLGAEQSGFIMEMGFEMYQRIVEEAVAELKRDEFAELFEHKPERAKPRPAETVVETDVEALIPDFYIESDAERLDIYRRLYSVQREEEIQTLRDELRDRFGEYPEETEHLFLVVQLKLLASQAGFRRVELLGETLTLTLPPADDQSFYDGEASPFQRLMAHVQSRADKAFRLKQQGNQLLLLSHIRSGNAPRERLWTARTLIQSLLVEEGKPLLVTELSRR
jgi:transcription-repair coupling factor (superfamily II helicase)